MHDINIAWETRLEVARRGKNPSKYPHWIRLFPVIQFLSKHTLKEVDFNQSVGKVLDDLYNLACTWSGIEQYPDLLDFADRNCGKMSLKEIKKKILGVING